MDTGDTRTPQYGGGATDGESLSAGEKKACRYCAAEIPRVALVCQYCRRRQPGTVLARWAMESPMKWVNLLTTAVAASAFFMSALALGMTGYIVADIRQFGDSQFARSSALVSEDGGELDHVFVRRRSWRDGESAPVLDSERPPLEVDAPAQRVVLGVGDVKQFGFDVDRAATYRIFASGVSGFDPFLYLFRLEENGAVVLENTDDDSGERVNAQIASGLTPGRYVVAVEGFGGAMGESDVGVTLVQ